MPTKPDFADKNFEGSQTSFSESPEIKREIYPQINERFKGVVIWLGIAFVVVVFLIQKFSGYS
jgi:hypothetical protein